MPQRQPRPHRRRKHSRMPPIKLGSKIPRNQRYAPRLQGNHRLWEPD